MPSNEMAGRVCMVTGATSGIGRSAAETLAARGAGVVLVARNEARGEAACDEIRRATGNDDVTLLLADLSSQKEIRSLAERFLATGRPLHVLLNNAGIINVARKESVDGIEATFAVNHLGYFLLTNLLLERMKQDVPARVVNVASDAHRMAGPLDFDDLQSRRLSALIKIYGRSKLANILFTRELASRLEGSGVTANSFHPGFVGSNFAKNNGPIAKLAMFALGPWARSTEKGAETGVHLCCAPEVEGESGGYYYDCALYEPMEYAKRDEDAKRLWEVSAQMVGLA